MVCGPQRVLLQHHSQVPGGGNARQQPAAGRGAGRVEGSAEAWSSSRENRDSSCIRLSRLHRRRTGWHKSWMLRYLFVVLRESRTTKVTAWACPGAPYLQASPVIVMSAASQRTMLSKSLMRRSRASIVSTCFGMRTSSPPRCAWTGGAKSARCKATVAVSMFQC